MKALTLTQPWATLVAIGAKKMETRSWPTNHRGPLAIHVGKSFPAECRVLVKEPLFFEALRESNGEGPNDILRRLDDVRGKVIATVTLRDCLSTGRDAYDPDWVARLSEREYAFGDYSHSRFGFALGDAKLIFPQAARGALGLWDWTPPAGVLAP